MSSKKKWVLGIGASVCLLAWLALAIGFIVEVEFATWFALVTVAALATEGFFWLVAGVFGMTLFEARKSIWRAVKEAPKRLLQLRARG